MTNAKRIRSLMDLLTVALLAAGAFVLRAVPPWRIVFRGGVVRVQEVDPWYYARLIENLAHHFPRMIFFDPYLLHPGGQAVPVTNFFDFAITAIAWIVGGGHPSSLLALRIAALVPPVLGALIVVPCFFTARWLWGRSAALMAGSLAAFLPGLLLGRSVLGFVDHHVAEVLSTATCLSLIVGSLFAAGSEVSVSRTRSWLAVGAGVALALYLLTWESGIFLVIVLAIWALLYGRAPAVKQDVAGTAMKVFLGAGATLAIAAPAFPAARHGLVPVLAAASVTAAVRFLRSRVSSSMQIFIWVGAGVLAVAALRLFLPERLAWLMSGLRRLRGSPESATVGEAMPYLRSAPYGLAFWRDYGSASLMALAGAVIAARQAIRDRSAAVGLVLLWSGVVLALMLAQTRFASYFAVAVSLLASCAVGALIPLFKRRRGASRLAMVGILLAFVGPGLRMAIRSAGHVLGPNGEWFESLSWLRRNSPEPFGDADYFEAVYPPIRESSYGVLSWWDYGYWIIDISHRVPLTNPTQTGAGTAAAILTEVDPVRAVAALRRLGARYIVTDRTMPLTAGDPARPPGGKFVAILRWAGQSPDRFFELGRYRDDSGTWRPVTLYYPDYFRCFVTRLQVFGARAVTPGVGAVWGVQLASGPSPRRIEAIRPLGDPAEIETFLAADRLHRRIASLDPLQSCISLPEIADVREIHASSGTFVQRETGRVGNVEIFETTVAVP